MATQNEHERVEKLLNELAEIGAGSFKAECRNTISRWRKIGMAISHTGNYGRECYELANTVAEDWNWHSMVAIVDFFLDKKPWDHTINYLKKGIDGVYTLHCYDCKDRKVKLTLTVEDLDE